MLVQVECSKARAFPSGAPSWKCLQRINTLAYLAHLLFTKKKHCAGSTVTENSAHNPWIEGLNTAGRWKMAKYMQRKKFCKLVQVECSKARACPSGAPSCKCLPKKNTLAYLAHH